MTSKQQRPDDSDDPGISDVASNTVSTGRSTSNRFGRPYSGTLGIGSGTFSGVDIGCVGAVILVVLTVGGVFGLLAMAWWTVLKK